MKINLPEFSMVVLVGPSGSGKSTFAKRHFLATEVISSDYCRGLVSDHENDQSATVEAFELLRYIATLRFKNRKLVVIDATNVQVESRRSLITLAREHDVLPVAIVFNLSAKLCHQRNTTRPNRNFRLHVVKQQAAQMRRSLRGLTREGFRSIVILDNPDDIDQIEMERTPLWTDRRKESGPFDIIGDIHGCFDELYALLEQLGYHIEKSEAPELFGFQVTSPEHRRVVFLGDLIDRGPKIPQVLALVMSMVKQGVAFCVQGNHEAKYLKLLDGRKVQIRHGLEQTTAQMEGETAEFKAQVREFIWNLRSHYILDDWRLVVAHAGLKEAFQGRASGRVRSFALYGETTGEIDEYGLPVRYNWAREYRGRAMVVYGHTPIPTTEWLNKTINIDTGCVFGGCLTALRYPELEQQSIPADQTYYEPAKPLQPEQSEATLTAQQEDDELLHFEDVSGKRIISTQLRVAITIQEAFSAGALEVMSRFTVNAKWLIYLPPTMSPSETSTKEGYLEYPAEAFAYYQKQGIEQVLCEEKHMGSRAIVIICRSEEVVKSRFGIVGEGIGICYSRIGRRFFTDRVLEKAFLARIHTAVEKAGFWEECSTDWLCLDCELMPWSMKAQALLQQQYAAVGSAAKTALRATAEVLAQANARGVELGDRLKNYAEKQDLIARYIKAYQHYCWPVGGLDDLTLAPFHLLASEGQVHSDKDHSWHMATIEKLCKADPGLLLATPYKVIDLASQDSIDHGINWWLTLTAQGGEGMVVKPIDFVGRSKHGIVQPALKCRGQEYLRIIYGPEYSLPENLQILRKRGLSRKRSMAIREFALGLEGLERFVRKEPLRRTHECAFGVMALESEPVDPRL